MPRMNWIIRKMKKASTARNFGTTSGRKVLTQPSLKKSAYCGIRVACSGSMMVSIISANSVRLKAKFSRAKA